MAAITHYDRGDIWKPQATFTVGGTPTDPTELVVHVLAPDGTTTTTTESSPATLTTASTPVARMSAGVFVLQHELDDDGTWYARFEGTGAATGAEDHEAIVDPSPFYDNGGLSVRALVTLAETKAWLGINVIDTSEDEKIVQRINAASERIMDVAAREFKPHGANPAERSFDIYEPCAVFHVGDMVTASSASTSATITDLQTGSVLQALTAADWVAQPRVRRPWQPVTSLRFLNTVTILRPGTVLNITGHWGFPSVPEDIRHACMDTVAFWLDRDVEHFRQDLGAVPGASEGGQTVIVGSSPTILPLPPEAYMIAKSYRPHLVG